MMSGWPRYKAFFIPSSLNEDGMALVVLFDFLLGSFAQTNRKFL